MNQIKKICKKDIPALLDDQSFWEQDFLAVSSHRLYSHYNNPYASDDDVVLLLAYIDDELVGYMGAYIDRIVLNNASHKIAWLSTWWVHPKTKGSGIGRDILNAMYEAQNGKIGISQFTPSAKRVYDKSGYFYDLKKSEGIKAVLKSHLAELVPVVKPNLRWASPILKIFDGSINAVYSLRQRVIFSNLRNRLKEITLEYLDAPDQECESLIKAMNNAHISPKNTEFFRWLSTYHWVVEAPLMELTKKERYEFSMYDYTFSIFLIKVVRGDKCIGFLVLQKRDRTLKILYAYYDLKHPRTIADIVKLHCVRLHAKEVITYDGKLAAELKRSGIFLYTRKKVKHSIISKAFEIDDFSGITLNYGDGDCSFA